MTESKYAAKLRRQGRDNPAMTPLDKLRARQGTGVSGAGELLLMLAGVTGTGRRPTRGVVRRESR